MEEWNNSFADALSDVLQTLCLVVKTTNDPKRAMAEVPVVLRGGLGAYHSESPGAPPHVKAYVKSCAETKVLWLARAVYRDAALWHRCFRADTTTASAPGARVWMRHEPEFHKPRLMQTVLETLTPAFAIALSGDLGSMLLAEQKIELWPVPDLIRRGVPVFAQAGFPVYECDAGRPARPPPFYEPHHGHPPGGAAGRTPPPRRPPAPGAQHRRAPGQAHPAPARHRAPSLRGVCGEAKGALGPDAREDGEAHGPPGARRRPHAPAGPGHRRRQRRQRAPLRPGRDQRLARAAVRVPLLRPARRRGRGPAGARADHAARRRRNGHGARLGPHGRAL